jgi:amidohydrolase
MPRSTDALLGRLLDGIERELPAAVELRHRLHARPELAHDERETAAIVAAAMPVACATVAGTGLLALVGTAAGPPPVAVRAELDGLPLQERTGAEFSGQGGAMHACGHDIHMAALVALARAASAMAGELPAPLLAVFQPSEEAYPSGADQLARGELRAYGPRAIVAAHIHPELAWGEVALDGGVINASYDSVTITVEGEPAHGAYPHLGRDPVPALCQIVLALHSQLTRRVDPLHAATLNVGMLSAGEAENVIPARATARAALRAHDSADRETLRAMVREVAAGVAAASGCRADVEIVSGEPPLVNDAAIVERARGLLAAARLSPSAQWRSCGSDDLAFLSELAPVAMAFVGLDGAAGFQPRPLHHPELLPPDEAVGAVARMQAVLFLAATAR